MTSPSPADPEKPVIPLGRNDSRPPETPRLADSELFPGMKAVVPDESGRFGSRTGRTDRQ